MEETKVYKNDELTDAVVDEVMHEVVAVLKSRGYNPINQIVGYLMSGDPGYISNYKDARNKITAIERTKILEILVKKYID